MVVAPKEVLMEDAECIGPVKFSGGRAENHKRFLDWCLLSFGRLDRNSMHTHTHTQ